jgi:hypothetical protein
MRAPKLAIAIGLLTPIMMLALLVSARAQISFPAGAPPAPLAPPPAPPGAPAALATPQVIPPLAPAPGIPSAGAGASLIASTPRPFACSCSGPGFNTHWVGNVVALSPITARQEASGACSAYNLNAHAQSPFIPPPQFSVATVPSSPSSANGSVVTLAPGTAQAFANQPLASGRFAIAAECSRCACD